MTRRPIDSVQISGWTAATAKRAVRLLTLGPSADVDGLALAQELLRWLCCATNEAPDRLVELLDEIRPSGANATTWDRLLESLFSEPQVEDLTRLHAERPGLVGQLCALLDDVAEQEKLFEELDREQRHAVRALVLLGAAEGLRYVLTHISLLCWNDAEALKRLVHPQCEALGAAALDVWEALTWHTRATLVLIFAENDLPVSPLVERLLAVDGDALDYEDRAQYVNALGYSEDAQAVVRAHSLLNRALETPALGEDGKRFVAEVVCAFDPEKLTADQRRRAAGCGVAGLDLESSDTDRSDAIH